MVKSFTTLALGCLLICGSAYATSAAKPALSATKALEKKEARSLKEANMLKNHKFAGTRADASDYEIITNPVGQYKYYYKNGSAEDSWYGPADIIDEPSVIVFGENNEVYFQDLYTLWYAGTFTKGTIENNVITVNLPQTINYWPDYGYGIELVLLKVSDADAGEFDLAENQVLTYTVDEATGAIEWQNPGEPYEYAIGVIYTDDLSLDGLEWNQEYTPVTDLDINTIPSGLEVKEYTYSSGVFGHPVYVANDDNYLYIKGLSETMPQSVVVAELDGDTAYINPGQIVGADYGMWIYTTSCYFENSSYVFSSDQLSLSVDWANNTITSNDQDLYLGLTADPEDPMYLFDVIADINIFLQESYDGTPLNPFNLFVDDEYLEETGFNYFGFSLPNVGTNGNVLDSDYLSYRIYVDGELMEFEPSDYEYFGLPDVTTEIPYSFTNGYDINLYDSSIRLIGLYMEGYTTLGVQTVYNYEGNLTESNIVELNVETGEESVGVESINAVSELNSVYYDLNGLKVAAPQNGIFIKRSTLSDGKVVVKKVVKK